MKINISNTTVEKFREVEDIKDNKVQCHNIKCHSIDDCFDCIFNQYGYTLEYLKEDNRLRN